MRELKPSAEEKKLPKATEQIEYAGRICRASTDKITATSYIEFNKRLANNKEWGPFEHAGIKLAPEDYERFKLSADSVEFGLVMSRTTCGSFTRCSDAIRFFDVPIDSLNDYPRDNRLISFEIVCSRDCSHQLVRHRNMSYCQESQRYCKYTDFDKFSVILPVSEKDPTYEVYHKQAVKAFKCYNMLLEQGKNPDTARYVLPGCTATRIFATADIVWWIDFLSKRYHPAASVEILTVAKQIAEQLKPHLQELFQWDLSNVLNKDQMRKAEEKLNESN